MQIIENQNVQKFKVLKQKNYGLWDPFIIFLSGIMLTSMGCYFLFTELIIFTSSIYGPLVIFNFYWIVIGFFWIINSVISYFMRKKASKYYIDYYRSIIIKSDSKLSTETFCRGCGIVISNKLFRGGKKKIIKYKTFFFTKGYYCEKCYKKYYFWLNIQSLFVSLLFFILFFQIYQFYQLEYLSILFLFILEFLLLLAFSFCIILIITNYIRLDKTYV